MKKLIGFSLAWVLFSLQGCASTNGVELLILLPGGNIVASEIKNKEEAERHAEEAKRKEIAQRERDKRNGLKGQNKQKQ